MCVRECEGGCELGIMGSKGEGEGEGRYGMCGEKMFMCGGEDEMGEKIMEIVVGGLGGGGKGRKGISVFMVGKLKVNGDG